MLSSLYPSTAPPPLALELSEDDDADSVKTVSPAAVNHTLVPLMENVTVDGQYELMAYYVHHKSLYVTYRTR